LVAPPVTAAPGTAATVDAVRAVREFLGGIIASRSSMLLTAEAL
jgi:pantothenate kinase type III